MWPNFPSVCHHLLTAYVSLVFSYKDTTSHWTSDSILTQEDFTSRSLTTCMFPNKVTLQAPRWTRTLGDTIHPSTRDSQCHQHTKTGITLSGAHALFLYLFLAVLGLCCCVQAFSSCGQQGLLSSCYLQASRCGGFSCGAQALGSTGFRSCSMWILVVTHGLSCSMACGVSLDQRLDLCPVHWQADS